VGKKQHKDKESPRTINVEIAPGNQEKLDLYIKSYNRRPDRATPKIKYTDVVNDALDTFLSAHKPKQRDQAKAPQEKGGEHAKGKEEGKTSGKV
jgi:hypothetical protein